MSNEATDFKSAIEMPLEAEIDAREVKKTVKRVMKLIPEENCGDSFFDEIYVIKDKADGEEDINIYDECRSFAKRNLSQQECEEVCKQLVKAIKKQLKKNHTFLVTARLIVALSNLTDELKLKKYNKKVRMCKEIVEEESQYTSTEVMFEFLSKLDKYKF